MSAQDDQLLQEKIASVPFWYHRIALKPGLVTPGINDSQAVLELLELPQHCSGARVLDIGARDGFFSFELERRGAEVLAIDYMPPDRTGCMVAKEILGSNVTYKVANVYDLDPGDYGTFDIVLFLGVLYHLRNPMLALDKIWQICRGRLWVESQVIDNAFLDMETMQMKKLSTLHPSLSTIPLMQFYPGKSLSNDASNYWAPNMACLKAMLEESNFVVDKTLLNGTRGIVYCTRADDSQKAYHRRIESSTF
jgi:tRNA (mo5U34)-methyltransferase